MSVTHDVRGDLSAFDQDYAPSEGGIRPGLDSLPDADYDCEIIDCDLGRTPKENTPVMRMQLRILSGDLAGRVVERPTFLTSQQSINILGADLCTLGFDADQWTPGNGRKFSEELPRVVTRLIGLRFRGRKGCRYDANKEKTFHNMYVNGLLAKGSSLPEAPPVFDVPSNDSGSAIPF